MKKNERLIAGVALVVILVFCSLLVDKITEVKLLTSENTLLKVQPQFNAKFAQQEQPQIKVIHSSKLPNGSFETVAKGLTLVRKAGALPGEQDQFLVDDEIPERLAVLNLEEEVKDFFKKNPDLAPRKNKPGK